MIALQRVMEEGFGARLCRYLREAHAEATAAYAGDELAEMVRAGVARARAHGIEVEQDIAFFVAMMFELSPVFDEDATVRQVLADEKLSIEDRVELLAYTFDDMYPDRIPMDQSADAWRAAMRGRMV